MSPKPQPLRTETMKIFDLRESKRSKPLRFWVGVACALIPLVVGLSLAQAWRLAATRGFETHVDVLSRIGLPTLALICFNNLYSRSLQRLRVTPMLVSLSFLWLAAGEMMMTLSSTLGFGSRADGPEGVGLGMMMLLNGGFGLCLMLGSRSASDLGRVPTGIGKSAPFIVLAGLLFPWLAEGLGRALLASPWFATLVGTAAVAAFLFAAWRLFLSYRIEYEPVRLALVLAALGGAGAQIMLLTGGQGDATATLFAVRVTLIAAVLSPIVVVVLKDLSFVSSSLPAQVRFTFNVMVAVILAAVTFIVAGLGDGYDAEAGGSELAAHLVKQQRSVLGLAGIVLACTCSAMLLATLACRRFLNNVEGLVDATRKLAQGKLESLVTQNGGTELTALTGAFNAMAERVFLQTRELRILARVMDGTSDPVLVLDPRMHIVYANLAFSTKTGWPRGATIGRSFRDLFAGDDASRKLLQIQEDIEAGQTWAGELAVKTKASGKLESFVTVSPVVHEGKIIQCVAVHRDLSALKRLESERLAFADNLVRMHTVTQDLVRSLDIYEVPRRAISGLAEHFGISGRFWMVGGGDRCADCNLASVCGNRDRGPCLELPQTTMRLPFGIGCAGQAAARNARFVSYNPEDHIEVFEHEPSSLHLEGVRAAYPLIEKGEIRGVLELGIPGNEHGRVLDSMNLLAEVLTQAMANARLHQQVRSQADYLQATMRDLKTVAEAQTVQAEELREANFKLIEADRLRSTFLSTTSHELRTPISGMMGYLRLVLDGLAEDRDEEMQFIRDAHSLAGELLEVINDVLDIAKIDSGRVTVGSEEIEVDDLILEVSSAHGEAIRAKNLELEIIEPISHLMVHADHDRLLQVLSIVVGNATKFSQTGIIRLSASAPGSGFVEFKIEDEGIGIDHSEIERVFEPFVQADAGDRRNYGGNGLGLTLARDLLALMGGTIRLESAGLGKGTTALISVPIGAQVADLEPLGEAGGSGPVVVIADSDPDLIALARQVVVERGGRVQVVANAASAFEVATRLQPDFILCEFSLPHQAHPRLRNGVDVARELSASSARGTTRFVLTTELDCDQFPLNAALRAMPSLEVVKKPRSAGELLDLFGLCAIETETIATAEIETTTSGRLHRVLLVDDDTRTSERVLGALRGSDFAVDFAQRGDEAIAALAQATDAYDVLLIDLLLPGMSLYQILETISGRERYERLAIVVLVHNSEAVTGIQDLVSLNDMVVGAVTKGSLLTAPHVLARAIEEAIQARQRRLVQA